MGPAGDTAGRVGASTVPQRLSGLNCGTLSDPAAAAGSADTFVCWLL